jgi:hypothetical protein
MLRDKIEEMEMVECWDCMEVISNGEEYVRKMCEEKEKLIEDGVESGCGEDGLRLILNFN